MKIEKYIVVLAVFVSAVCFAAEPTKTLPIVYVNTQNGQGIYDTETQIPATVYIDSVKTKYPSLGSASAPKVATIKGRGNWTWSGFDKKPYKIKFDQKTKVLGMPNNRHWCLQANADDPLGFMRNSLGHKLSKALGLRWTPRMRPVELVLNGEYKGFYFLTEHVRIAGHRVDIVEQEDGETHRDSITGGWLVEIDNYHTDNNIEFWEGNGAHVMISLREPKNLSGQQRSYLEQQLYALNDALYGSSSADLERLLDIEEAAKYYLVQEIMEDTESFHGSCFLYKDRDSLGVADKWKFGPVWDFGNAYSRHEESWIYINPTWPPQVWIGRLNEWPVFQQALMEQWWLFYHNQKEVVRKDILELADQIQQAAIRDADVWRGTQNYCDNSNFADVRDRLLRRYDWRINWLYEQWGEGVQPKVEGVEDVQRDDVQSTKIVRDGQLLIIRGGKTYTLQGQQTH